MPTCRKESIEFATTAPFTVQTATEVSSSPQQVWAALTDAAGWPDWFEGMKTAEMTSETFDVGGSRRVKVGPMTVDEEFIAWDPLKHWGFTVTAVGWTTPMIKAMVELVELAPTDSGGTTLTYKAGLELSGWAKPLGKVFTKQMDSSWATGFGNLDGYIARG